MGRVSVKPGSRKPYEGVLYEKTYTCLQKYD